MKVKKLIGLLSKMPLDSEIILQKDGEGNSYSPLEGVDGDCIYTPNTTWSGDVVSTCWDADDACMSKASWIAFKANNPRCVVLYPVN